MLLASALPTVARQAFLALMAWVLLAHVAVAQTTTGANGSDVSTGPVRLRSTPPVPDSTPAPTNAPTTTTPAQGSTRESSAPVPRYMPGEFEKFVEKIVGPDVVIKRFGAELVTPSSERGLMSDASPLVPPDYLIKNGDELLVTLWGSVDADIRVIVDRSGRITIPRIGPILVAGVRYADAPNVIGQRVSQVFKNFQLSVSLAQLRAQRVYVTGFVARPGAYSVGALATVTQALLQAGGPSAAGSFRNIEVRRGKERVASLDLYDFLLLGDRGADRLLQPEDVIHVGPLGTQVAVIGSINRPAIFELKAGETLSDALRMAGGFTAVADRSRVAVERLDDRATTRIAQLALPESASSPLATGDVLRAFSAVDSVLPVQRQNKRVRVEGEVVRPGEYVLPASSTVTDALAAAGGMTASAFPYGTEFNRESVRLTQQQNFDRALRDLEVELARSVSTQRSANASEEATAQASRSSANDRLLASLRALRPSGRIVLQLQPDSRELPPLALEDGDRLYVPARPSSVGVFGSVFNGGNYLYSEGRLLDDYLGLAGGPTKGADASSAFVIRANGSVISGQQKASGALFARSGLGTLKAEPGDTVFVPEEMNKTTFVQAAKDWTQILYQFGLGIAGIVAATR